MERKRLPRWLEAAKAKAEYKKAVEAGYMSTRDWIRGYQKKRAEKSERSELSVSNGNLLPFSGSKTPEIGATRCFASFHERSGIVHFQCTLSGTVRAGQYPQKLKIRGAILFPRVSPGT